MVDWRRDLGLPGIFDPETDFSVSGDEKKGVKDSARGDCL